MSSDDMEHQHTPEEERKIREAALDQTIEGSFPVSDPPSSNPNPDDHGALERQRPKDRSKTRRGLMSEACAVRSMRKRTIRRDLSPPLHM